MKAEALKKSILQYAMQGKLVAQDSNDEPASELLKRIKAEKEQLIKDGKILKKKPLNPFTESDEPFDIPESWIWVYLSDVSIIQEGAGIRSYQYRDSGTQLLTVTNILEDGIDLDKSTKFVDTEEYLNKYKHLTPQKGDIVILENPEAHIHPAGQRKLGELIAQVGQSGVQIIVETHSDHIMNGIRVAVKKQIVEKEKTNFVYFYKDSEDNYSHKCILPQIDKNGKFNKWPEGFFDEWDNSLIDLL